MAKNVAKRAVLTVVLAAAVATTAGVLPARAASPEGKLGNQFTYTYYANAAHTGEPVGELIYGYCPSYFSRSFGTRTNYFVTSEEAC